MAGGALARDVTNRKHLLEYSTVTGSLAHLNCKLVLNLGTAKGGG